ncbi:DUF4184 family protein [Echinicola sp. CAU 1574]|uniref:DUF4184 family protein n=1 Tax=Echinicola arenosa TaxID=2774144 RepID=A0ABR9AJG2_9BACT|nr:DUF4184 family protein [Echinicola arenosa]MBD8488970.1 DUF4184 family protein [Echinicola arenosa]
MPFTLSHPVYLLPFKKALKPLSATALIVGSMVPDFEFFLKMKAGENIGHHPWGILLLDIPLGIILCLLFHLLVRDLFIKALPETAKSKLIRYVDFDWLSYFKKHSVMVIFSLVVGIASHLFLDAFTHYDGWAVLQIPLLSITVKIFGKPVPCYFLLQIISSIIGLLGIFVFYKKLPSTFITPTSRSPYFAQILLVSVITLGVRAIVLPEHLNFWDIVMSTLGSLVYSMVLVGILYSLGNNRRSYKIIHRSAINPLFNSRRFSIKKNKLSIGMIKLMMYMNNFIDPGKVYLFDFRGIHIHLIKPSIGQVKNMVSKFDNIISDKSSR